MRSSSSASIRSFGRPAARLFTMRSSSEILERNDRNLDAEEIPEHRAGATGREMDTRRSRQQFDARRRVTHAQDLPRRGECPCDLIRRGEAELPQDAEHALDVVRGEIDPEIEIRGRARIAMQRHRVAPDEEERDFMGRQQSQELAQVVRRRPIVHSTPPCRVPTREAARHRTCRARSPHPDRVHPSIRPEGRARRLRHANDLEPRNPCVEFTKATRSLPRCFRARAWSVPAVGAVAAPSA